MDTLIPNDTVDAVQKSRCLLCGHKGTTAYTRLSDQLYAAPGLWNICECPSCALMWLHPLLGETSFDDAYANYYTHNPAVREGMISRLRTATNAFSKRLGQCWLGYGSVSMPARLFARLTYWLRPMREMAEMQFCRISAPARGSVLDIGCGSGQILLNLRNLGWQVTGLEIDQQAVQIARDRGFVVWQGSIDELEVPETRFDVIILNHVIEHLSDPIGCLKKCAAMLTSTGRLVVVTPNLQGLAHRTFRQSWRGLEVPRHLVLFSPRSLEAAGRASGLTPIRKQTLIRGARFMHRQSSLMRAGATRIEIDHSMSFSEKVARLVRSYLFQLAEWFVTLRNPGAGDEIYMEFSRRSV